MKYLLSLLFLTLSINCYGETNREILEDIREELEFMQYERELRKAYGNRGYDNQNRSPQNPPAEQSMPYRNILSEVDRVKQAKFWGLNMSEYLRKDEIGSLACERYRGAGVNTFSICYYSKMLNISYTETETRWNKLMNTCSKMPSASPKREQCIKNILVNAN